MCRNNIPVYEIITNVVPVYENVLNIVEVHRIIKTYCYSFIHTAYCELYFLIFIQNVECIF